MSLNFKDFVKRDNDNVFFNENEFAQMHLIDNRPTMVIIDNVYLNELQSEGIFEDEVMIYVKKKDFISCPRVNSIMKLDNQRYIVSDVKDLEDNFCITLSANTESSPHYM